VSKYTSLTDSELLMKIKKFDSRALEEIYDRYSTLLYTLVFKIVAEKDIAEKIIVNLFGIIWKKSSQINFEKGSGYTWLVLLARNLAVDFMQRKNGNTKSEYNTEYEDYFIFPHLAEGIDDLDYFTAKNILPKLKSAYHNLTDAQKYVIDLAFYSGYNLEQIAKELNIPVETVRSKIMTSLQNLRDNLLSGEVNSGEING